MSNGVKNQIAAIVAECKNLDLQLHHIALNDGSNEEVKLAISTCAIRVRILADKFLSAPICPNRGIDGSV